MIVSLEEQGPAYPLPGPSALPQASSAHPQNPHMEHAQHSQQPLLHGDGDLGFMPAQHPQQDYQQPHPEILQQQSDPSKQQQQRQQYADEGPQQSTGTPSARTLLSPSHQQSHHVTTGFSKQHALKYQDTVTHRPQMLRQGELANSNGALQHGQRAQADQTSTADPQGQAMDLQHWSHNLQSLPEDSSASLGGRHSYDHPKAASGEPQGSSGSGIGSQHLGTGLGPWYSNQPGQPSLDVESSEVPAAAEKGISPGPATNVIPEPGAGGVLGMAQFPANSNAAKVGSLAEPREHASEQHSLLHASPVGVLSGGSAPDSGSRQNGASSHQPHSPEQKAALDVLAANVSSLDAAQQSSSPRWDPSPSNLEDT